MIKLIQAFISSLIGVVLFYTGCYGFDQAVQNIPHYSSFGGMIFSMLLVGGSGFIIIYPIEQLFKNRKK